MIVYDFLLSAPQDAHSGIAPFELFREPLIIVGIGDSREYQTSSEANYGDVVDWRRKQFLDLANVLHDQYPRILLQRILLFDEPGIEQEEAINDEFYVLPDDSGSMGSILERVVRSMTIALRRELYTYSKSIQALPSIPSPTVPHFQTVQAHYHGLDSPITTRPGSFPNERVNTTSPADQKISHRMSMPVFSSSNIPDMTSRSESPGGKRQPPQTFDEMTGATPAALNNGPIERLRPRPESLISSRTSSQDRVSVHGFGSDSSSEKTRNKGLGRIAVVQSGLFLIGGRWQEALKEAMGGAMKARTFNDHLWYAKALEHIAVSMILLAWAGMEFQIPNICYTPMETQSSNRPPNMLPEYESRNDVVIKAAADVQAQATLMKMLASLMPGLTNMIQNVYGRPNSTGSGGAVPFIVYSEVTVRLTKLLTVMNLSGGTLRDDGIKHLFLGKKLNMDLYSSVSRLRLHPSRRDIVYFLERALPEPLDHSALTPADHAIVLAGVASVFSLLGMQRKEAMMMKEFLLVLIPVLQQAKVASAAEAGIHPSAGQSALAIASDASEWHLENGIESFLNAICHAYDIPESSWSESIGNELLQNDNGGEAQVTPLPRQLLGSFILRSFGDNHIKADVLRTCIQLCEALSDYRGVLHYSSTLLRVAGPGIASSAETTDVLVNLGREEQMYLANTIFKTSDVAKSAGQAHVLAEYWDEFLVRGFYLLEPVGGLVLRPHRKADLKKVESRLPQRDPFIHNPFLDKSSADAPRNLLSAKEQREFVVLLQNPYEFEVEIESLKLCADEHDDLCITKTDFLLKPYRTQSFSLSGTFVKEGSVNVTGCIIKAKGCRERLFPIFSEPWTPESGSMVKNIGMRMSGQQGPGRNSDISVRYSGGELKQRSFPTPASINLNIIPEQPSLIIESSSVAQDSLMLLDGQRTSITLQVRNISKVPADFLLVSYQDTATKVMQEAIAQKGIPPADLYEIEYQTAKLPVITAALNQPSSIPAASSATFTFHILGKAGLTEALIQFDYSNISTPHTVKDDMFFTRRITYPLSVTVNASILVHRAEIASLSRHFSWQIAPGNEKPQAKGKLHTSNAQMIHELSSAADFTQAAEEHCLLLLDLRNSWPSPLNINLRVVPEATIMDKPVPTQDKNSFTTTDQIQPGQVSRQVILIPKIYITEPHRRIKPLSPAHQRQFVVSTDKTSPELELLSRENFWFREALLSRLTGSWYLDDGHAKRTGSIDLRTIQFSVHMLDNLRLPDMGINMSAHGPQVVQLGNAEHSAPVDSFLVLNTRLKNRSSRTIFPLLRLRPNLADQPREVALDLSKRFAWSGVLQRTLPPLLPGGEILVELPVRALCSGEYEIGATVEEIKVAESGREDEPHQDDRHGRELDDFVQEVSRRTWSANLPCKLKIVDQEIE